MEQANKFFFLANVNSNVNCDFRRSGDKMMLTFCNVADKEQTDRLEVTIHTEKSSIDHYSNKEVKQHFISYQLETKNGVIKQADSNPIISGHLIWAFVTAIVNDVFQA